MGFPVDWSFVLEREGASTGFAGHGRWTRREYSRTTGADRPVQANHPGNCKVLWLAHHQEPEHHHDRMIRATARCCPNLFARGRPVLGMTASFHAIASIPFFLIREGGTGYNPEEVAHVSWTIDKQGYASLPQRPGLGVEIDQQTVDKMPKNGGWPNPRHNHDGAIADY